MEGREVSQDEVRTWLRKMYKSQWTYNENIITINCDGEEFMINPDNLDLQEKLMLKKILTKMEKEHEV